MLPSRDAATPAYRWFYAALRVEILEGRLRPGARLPGTRGLADQYGLSRGTIVNAYEQLASEGYVEGSVGSGTYVSRVLPEELLEVRRGIAPPPAAPRTRKHRVSDYGERVKPLPGFEIRPSRASAPTCRRWTCSPPCSGRRSPLGACGVSRRVCCWVAARWGTRRCGRQSADYMSTSRGVKCVPAQVAIVSGVQGALDLVARLFLNPGTRACMEDPGYLGATAAFEAVGAKISHLRSDGEGMVLREPRLRGARLVYTTPAHQYPLGMTMSLPRRLQLLEWARQAGALIFEDDYDREFRYSGRPVPALQGLDRSALVLYAGSFSKVLFPSLRLGYLVSPSELVPHVEAARSVTSRHAPLLEQAVLCDFITEGHFGRQVRRMREIYGERLSVLLETGRQRLAGLLEISPVEAGLQTVGWLRGGIDGESAAEAAAERDVEVVPLSRYRRGRAAAADGLVLGFAAADGREIRRGVSELAAVLEGIAG